MATKNMRYTLDDISSILFNGFDYTLSEEVLSVISEIALQVGSPDYVKTPVFKKRENPLKQTTQPLLDKRRKSNEGTI